MASRAESPVHDEPSLGGAPQPSSALGHPPERWPLVSAAEMRALDRYTIDELGVDGQLLMESAGRAVVDVVLALLRERAGEVVVVCGRGNNGGDGFVIARHVQALGVPVRAVLVGGAGKRGGASEAGLQGDAAANFARAQKAGVVLEWERWRKPDPAIIVDALFGTGLSRAIDGAAGAAIRRIDRARRGGARVVAVDLPSGFDADTGQPLGPCVSADVTVTIGLPKRGLALEPARTQAGRVVVARVGIADQAPAVAPGVVSWTERAVARALPERGAAGHKGSFGHVLVVAGSEGKTGAAALSARAAGRAGAGLVTVACPSGLNDILETLCVEAMTVPVPDHAFRGFAAEAEEPLLELAHERDVLALGPGIGTDEETARVARALATRCERPLVLDADGLNAFGDTPEALQGRSAATLLTPHPGEAGRLLGRMASAVNADRVGAARELAARSGAHVLLKGPGTVIAEAGGEGAVAINPTGCAALATGGTGDVLTGLCAALLAQGAGGFEAGVLAAYVHGRAAEAIAQEHGDAGLLASQLADALPGTLRDLRALCDDRSGERIAVGQLLDYP